MQLDRISYTYERNLQVCLNRIGDRGICIHKNRLEAAKGLVGYEIERNLKIAARQWGCHVFIGAANDLKKDDPGRATSVNLNATQGDKKLLDKLKDLGYDEKLMRIRAKNEEGEYESRDSVGELVLQKLLVASTTQFPGGDPAIRAVLKIRELGKIKSSYLNARLYSDPNASLLYLSQYNAAGTLSGRRSSKKHIFGYGNNAQNFPTHGELSDIFKRCLIPRPGNIFLFVDQKSAEEWPVNALAENYAALDEMSRGVNRHIKLASYLFNVPVESKSTYEWKKDIMYLLGKKTRHANNYDMREATMADSLAKEGKPIPIETCKTLLFKLNQAEPNIKGVFHKWVENELSTKRRLVTPWGRERDFMGLRSNGYNGNIFREAYAYIPQSTVGDNNGFAVYHLENDYPSSERAIIQEGHDSIAQDVKSSASHIWMYLQRTVVAYDRKAKFHNGIELQIPIEAELGYSWNKKVKIKEPFSYENVVECLKECNYLRQQELDEEERDKKDGAMAQVLQSI